MGKHSKWLKWQIGGGATLALSLVFNAVREDPAFAVAQQQAANNAAQPPHVKADQDQDRVWQEFQDDGTGHLVPGKRHYGIRGQDGGSAQGDQGFSPRRQRRQGGDSFGMNAPDQGSSGSGGLQAPQMNPMPQAHTRSRRS